MDERSERMASDGRLNCSGTNLHVVWDTKLLEAATGFTRDNDAPALARQLRGLFVRVQAAEAPLTARTSAEWRAVVERWHTETQALITRERIYPPDGAVGTAYLQRYYPIVRLQVLRAAVRLAAMLQQSL
jgi:hypothetical protein